MIGTLAMETIAYIKLKKNWNNTFSRRRFHFSGKDIHVHGSNTLGENKSQENETSKQNYETQK